MVEERAEQTIEQALRELVRREEAAADREADSLWDHLLRTSMIAQRLGRAEGVDPEACRLGALFHDAGKFRHGKRHGDNEPEEKHAVEVLRRLGTDHCLPEDQISEISEAILQLYRCDPDPTPLARVLFDSDNLDKLGHLGIANLFVKRGLRGRGFSPGFLVRQLTVELTYARHAEGCMQTEAGREWARRRAPQTRDFLFSLLDQLREDGLANLEVRELEIEGMTVDAVMPPACGCGTALVPEVRQEEGIKCTVIFLEHTCDDCGDRYVVRFCRPRLPDPSGALSEI